MYIRWMGAFGHQAQLKEAICFELTRNSPVACEKIGSGKKSAISHARVGLIVAPDAIYKKWKGDVYSRYDEFELLYNIRGQFSSTDHTECWAYPVFTGIVIKNASFKTLSYNVRCELKAVLEEYPELPVYKLKGDKLIKEHIE